MILSVELWCIENRDTTTVAYQKSILDNPDTLAILEMAGRTMYSQNVREPDLVTE